MYSSHYNLLDILLAYDPTVKETKHSNLSLVAVGFVLQSCWNMQMMQGGQGHWGY